MAALTVDNLLRSLKKKSGSPGSPGSPPLEPVYLLQGDEDVLKDEAIRAIVDAAVGTARDFNVDTRYAGDLTPESLNDLVNTPPMLAERRAVVLRAVDQLGKRKSKARDELLRYLGNPNPTTVLVLVVSAGEEPDSELARQATVIKSEPLDADRIPRWVNHRAGIMGLTIAADAIELLITAVGGDLSALARELEKLAALAAGTGRGRTVTTDDVWAVVGVRRGETVYDLVEAALARNVAKACRLVDAVLEQAGMNGVRVVSLLGTHLVGTALARAERDRGGGRRLPDLVFRRLLAARPYGLRGYKDEAVRWSSWSELWTRAELRRALRAALLADVALKNPTVSDDRGIVMQLVLGFAPMKQEAA